MTEKSAVQDPMVKYCQQIGWDYINYEKALELREGASGLFFKSILRKKLLDLNPNILNQENVDEVIRQLSLISPTIEGNKKALDWMKGKQSIFITSEKRERNICLIDFENSENNQFQVTDEWNHQGAVFNNRADVIFLINGLPVAICETKNANDANGLAKGMQQLRRYHQETPEFFIFSQLFEVTELVRFYYGGTWNTSRKSFFNWKDEQPANNTDTYEKKVKSFFDHKRFLKILQNYVLFLKKDEELVKIVLRQHQTRAIEKVVDRASDREKRRGLIWHTQGSGKTLTMISIASRLLKESPHGEKPTIVMIIDRNELETQLDKNLAAYGLSEYKLAQSKLDLQEAIASDYRGLIVSMIHKFDKIPANLNPRESIVVLVDEAHRTTGGKFGNFLVGALPNATYIGFTGTPIDRLSKGKGTFKVFGCDDEQGYLDKYSISESIDDQTTVALNYALARSDLLVDRETLEVQFLQQADAEGVSDIDELNAILDRAVELKEMMKSPERIDAIAKSVAEHFQANVEPMGFKAFVVAVDREACVLYKKVLDQYLPEDYSIVVYSGAHNDQGDLKKYQLGYDEEKKIRKEFLDKEKKPKILIVTEKLLTGYDAPILYCMYLDKPMRDHVLLQTIARVNRPYEDREGQVKPYGLVYDFVGIFEKLERALSFDSDVVASVIQNIDVLKQLFETLMKEQAPKYLPFAMGFDDKSKDRAIQHFENKELREAFFKLVKQIQNLYDILSPDVCLRPHLVNYQHLVELYAVIRNAYSDNPYIDRELTKKTRNLLQANTTFANLQMPGEIYQLSAEELRKMRRNESSDTTKVLNLSKVLGRLVAEQGTTKPFLISIGEKASALAEAYEDRHLTTQEALERFLNLADETIEAEAERNSLNLDENSFAIYKVIRDHNPALSPEEAQHINAIFERHPNHLWNQQEKNQLRASLYKELISIVGKDNIIDVANQLFKLQRV